MKNIGFMPNISCPHCKHKYPVDLSGFARTGYNSRSKQCPKCNEEFIVEAYVSICKKGESISDGDINETELSIKYWRKHRKKTAEERLVVLSQIKEVAKREDQELTELAIAKQIGAIQ